MSFLFEYIGEMGKDYIHSVVTCLEDALTDRDLVHRQTAGSIVKHLALGTAGLGNEDAHLHLMNLIWPNVFESKYLIASAHSAGYKLTILSFLTIFLSESSRYWISSRCHRGNESSTWTRNSFISRFTRFMASS